MLYLKKLAIGLQPKRRPVKSSALCQSLLLAAV